MTLKHVAYAFSAFNVLLFLAKSSISDESKLFLGLAWLSINSLILWQGYRFVLRKSASLEASLLAQSIFLLIFFIAGQIAGFIGMIVLLFVGL